MVDLIDSLMLGFATVEVEHRVDFGHNRIKLVQVSILLVTVAVMVSNVLHRYFVILTFQIFAKYVARNFGQIFFTEFLLQSLVHHFSR